MKRIVLMLCLVLFFCVSAEAQQRSISSGLVAADAVIVAKPVKLNGLILLTNGTNEVTAVLYDNATTNSGTVLAQYKVVGATFADSVMFPIPVVASKGIYLDITGSGGNVIVYYEP